MSELEKVDAPKIGGTLPHDHYIKVMHSIAVSLKRIADKLDAATDPGIPIYASRDATDEVLRDHQPKE